MINADTRVVGVAPSLTRSRFVAILTQAASPAAAEASSSYDAIVSQQVDPAFALALFHHESDYARNPQAVVVRYRTKNPGNTRTSRTGRGTTINTDRGPFVKFASWVDGWRDLAVRLADPTYLYAQEQRVNVARIIERWAPASDGNDPAAYVAAVVADMNRWAAAVTVSPPAAVTPAVAGAAGPPAAAASPAVLWYPAAVHKPTPNQGAAADQHRSWPAAVDRIVMHHTDGTAASTIGWFGNPAAQVSAHFLVARDGAVYQFVGLDQLAWHAGTMAMNTRSVGIEHEQFRVSGGWSDWPGKQLEASARLIAWLLALMPGSTLVTPHSSVVSTGCPGDLPINHILELAKGVKPAEAPTFIDFPQTGKRLQGGFLRFWEAFGGLPIFGYPISNELKDEHGLTIQWFERARFEWHPGSDPSRWDVQLGRLGAELRETQANSYRAPSALGSSLGPLVGTSVGRIGTLLNCGMQTAGDVHSHASSILAVYGRRWCPAWHETNVCSIIIGPDCRGANQSLEGAMQSQRSRSFSSPEFFSTERPDIRTGSDSDGARADMQRVHHGEGPLWIRLLLVLSCMSPLFLLWAIRGTDMMTDWKFCLVCLALFVTPNAFLLWLIYHAQANDVQRTIQVGQADDRRQDIIPYLFAILLPFYAVDLSTARAFAATIAAFLIVVVLFTSLNLHYMNFLVALFGYHCYQVRTPDPEFDSATAGSFVVVTKRSQFRSGSRLTGYLVSSTILVERQE